MGKSQNPVEADRRKQRKKEIQKNKEKRINERDERVKKTKTVPDVKKEIKEFEKRHKHQLGQHDIKSKLDRLKKELKLVEGYEEQRKKDGSLHPKRNFAASNDSKFVKLDRPEISVYYDAQYNPYGAAPPGKPMLFHRYGGGVTMNIKEAVVPGESLPFQSNIPTAPAHQPPPPPPSGPPSQSAQNRNNMQGREGGQDQAPLPPQNHPASHAPPPPPPPPPPPAEEKPPPPPPPPIKKEDLPSLPAPSESVRRTRRRQKGLTADIWASSEEVAYEKTINDVDLEDAAGASTLVPEKDEWHYIDTAGNTQGPFPTQHMQSWHGMGYFPPATKVKKTGRHADFVAIGTLGPHVFAPSIEKKPKRKGKKKDKQKQKEEEEAEVQARIAALKGTTQQQSNATAEEKEPPDDSVQARIAALRADKLREEEHSVPEDDVQARIAALKNGGAAAEAQEGQADDEQDAAVQARIAALRNDLKQQQSPQQHPEAESDDEAAAVQDRIAALKQEQAQEPNEQSAVEQPSGPAPPPPERAQPMAEYPAPYPVDEGETAVAPYPVDEGETGVAPYPVDEGEAGVAPYPVDEGEAGVAPYPVDEGDGEGMAAYPVDEAYPADVPYPVDEEYPADVPYPTGDEVAYPVTDDYPVNDAYPVDDAYPVNDAYPSTENPDIPPAYPTEAIQENNGDAASEPAKKKVKVDKALVSLLPSHLQKKRINKK